MSGKKLTIYVCSGLSLLVTLELSSNFAQRTTWFFFFFFFDRWLKELLSEFCISENVLSSALNFFLFYFCRLFAFAL